MQRLGVAPQSWLVTLGVTGWSAAWLAGHGVLGFLLPLVVCTACLVIWRAPVVACVLVCGAQIAALLSDLPRTSPAGLVPALVCLLALGLSTRPRVALPLVALFVAIVVATGLPGSRPAVGAGLFLTTWALGDHLRRRRERLRASHERAALLEAEDARKVADRLVDGERRRILAHSAQVVATAMAEVRGAARRASEELDAAQVSAVRTRAVTAVDRLRELVELVTDDEPGSAPVDTQPPRSSASTRLAVLSFDVALAVGALLVGWVDLRVDALVPSTTTVLLGSALAGSLALRRTAPTVATSVAALTMATAAVLHAPMSHGVAESLVLILLTWNAVRRRRRLELTIWMVLLAATVAVAQQRGDGYPAVAAASMLVVGASALLQARARAAQEAATARLARVEATTDAVVQDALVAGRARVARDLHDVVGHALGVMVMQAGMAEVIREHDPEGARAALARVAGTGDEALVEIDALAVDGDSVSASFGDSLAALVQRIRAAGIVLEVQGTLDLPAGPVATVLFRVVQEALTNAVKHAPGTRVGLALACRGGTAYAEIVNDPPPPGAGRGPGTRRGLAGLAARVAECGGRFEAVELPAGGFAIRASVPVGSSTSVTDPGTVVAGRERVS